MANCLLVPMASSLPCSSSSSPSLKQRSIRTLCSMNSAKFPMPPLNPKDPFLSKLASVAATSPEVLYNSQKNSDTMPFLDIFDGPTHMAYPAQAERYVSYNGHRTRRPPPDLPSLMLDSRIVYIGMPLVPAVTELVIAQLMYLGDMSAEPINLYINSTGTTRDDGEVVGMEAEGFAIYDTLFQVQTEIRTICLGYAIGQACLLLAAGTKGKRHMMPHSMAMIQQPRIPSSGLMQASDVLIRAKEAVINRDTLVELLSKHTGNPIETVAKVMRRPFYMNPSKAKQFGVIDKIIWHGQEQIMKQVAPPDEWETHDPFAF